MMAAASPVWAQQAPAGPVDGTPVGDDDGSADQAGTTRLQRLIIGAGHEKVAIDTPQAVTVVDQEDIDRDQPTMVGDTLKRIPGVATTGSDRMMGQTFNIRGIGAPEFGGEEGRIIVNVDGANKYFEQYRMGGFFSEPELFKKVEVLRGPASSTLYGSGALGGVINFVTKDASDFIADGQSGALKLKGTWNSNGNGWLKSGILAQRFGDNVEFLASGNYRISDNYVTGDGTEIRSSDFETWSGLAKLTVSDGYEGRLRMSYQHWDSDADDQDYTQVGTDTLFGTVDRHVVDRTAVVSYENPFSDNNWLDLKLSASFSDTAVDQSDASGIPAFFLSCANYDLFCDTEYGYQTWQAKAENTVDHFGRGWDNHLTYGYQFAHRIRSAEVDSPAGSVGLGNHPEGADTKHAFYFQNEAVFDDRFTFIPGVRWEWRSLSPYGTNDQQGEVDDFALSPKLAVHYRISDGFALFGSYAHTERFPTIDEIYSTSGNNNTFDPSYDLTKELSDNIEAGFALSAYDLFAQGDSLQIKTTAFHNQITDLIDNNPALNPGPNPGQPGYVNIDNAEIYGVEVELAYDSTYVFASAGYSSITGRNTDTNEHLTTVAPEELTFTLGGRIPEHDLSFGWKSRFVSDPADDCRVSTTSVTCSNGSASRYSKAFDVHDVFLTWTPDHGLYQGWEARLGVDNLFDAEYKEFLHNDPARGRTFKVTLARTLGW